VRNKYCYFPILKTTDAELKAYSFLDEAVQNKILPIFELTRSRRSKRNPNADISKRIDKIKEIAGNRRFILDLTTEKTLSNIQIDDMLNLPGNGFKLWVSFIKKLQNEALDVIPIIHYNPSEIEEVEKEISALQKLSPSLAFRVSIDDEDAFTYITQIASTYDISQLILILDGKFISLNNENDSGDKSDDFTPLLNRITMRLVKMPKETICSFSSFPSAVGKKPYGGYNEGSFKISEVITNKSLLKKYPFVLHGDYGSVHPYRYDAAAGGWIPRIDFLTEDTFFYHRHKRLPDDGGYIKAAKKVMSNINYRKIKGIDVWGDQEIASAADGIPNGSNPAHWIAVRINLYITKQYLRLKDQSYISL
jgi:hypothetical protein